MASPEQIALGISEGNQDKWRREECHLCHSATAIPNDARCERVDNRHGGHLHLPRELMGMTRDGYSFCFECAGSLFVCARCDEFSSMHHGGRFRVHGGYGYICQACLDRGIFPSCTGCGDLYCEDDLRSNDYGDYYCDGCWEDEHQNLSECEARHQDFTFPIADNPEGGIRNDTRLAVKLPVGEISHEGLCYVYDILRRHMERAVVDSFFAPYTWDVNSKEYERWGKWQTREGNFTKRLAKAALQAGAKLPKELIAAVGNIARDHTASEGEARIEFTRRLNGTASDFYHGGSCWWQSYSASRCLLKTHGGIGVRGFDHYHGVTGRVWVQPLRHVPDGEYSQWEAISSAQTADAFAVFNGYGMPCRQWARVIALLTGHSYKHVEFAYGDAFVNDDSAYLVGPQALLDPCLSIRLELDKTCGCYAENRG